MSAMGKYASAVIEAIENTPAVSRDKDCDYSRVFDIARDGLIDDVDAAVSDSDNIGELIYNIAAVMEYRHEHRVAAVDGYIDEFDRDDLFDFFVSNPDECDKAEPELDLSLNGDCLSDIVGQIAIRALEHRANYEVGEYLDDIMANFNAIDHDSFLK